MPRHLARDARTSLSRALRHACGLARRYVSGKHLMSILVSAVSAVHPGPGRPARAVLHSCGATVEDVAEEIARRAGPEALTQAVHREPRPAGLKGRPSSLVLLQRAHPGIFEDALWAVINKAEERDS